MNVSRVSFMSETANKPFEKGNVIDKATVQYGKVWFPALYGKQKLPSRRKGQGRCWYYDGN